MKHRRTTPKLFYRARDLRLDSTEAEAKLWAYLRAHRLNGMGFRRQHAMGRYIVDFCAPKIKLIIELDGSQHLNQVERDSERTAYLQSKGWRVLRFWNNDVMNDIDGVVKSILNILSEIEQNRNVVDI